MEVKRPSLVLALVVILLPVVHAESDPQASTRPAREYQGRVQMHSAPTQIRVPEESLPDKATMKDRFQQDIRPSDSMSIKMRTPQISQPPIQREMEKDRRSKTWIHLGTDSDGGKPERHDDKGWGWLANDVLGRQESERAKAEEEDNSETTSSLLPTERLLHSMIGHGGLVMQPSVGTAPADDTMRDTSLPPVINMLVYDEDMERGKAGARAKPHPARETGTGARERTPQLPSPPTLQTFVGSSSGRDRDSGSPAFLPQTAALLSRPAGLETRRLPSSGRLSGETPDGAMRAVTAPSLFSPAQAGGPVSLSSSWEKPFSPSRSMFESSSGNAFDSSGSAFSRDPFGSATPTTPIQTPAATPATRPTVDFYGPSWRR